MLRLQDRCRTADLLRQDDGTAAHEDQIYVRVGDLHGVHTVFHQRADRGHGLVRHLLRDGCGLGLVTQLHHAEAHGDIGGGHHIAAEYKSFLRDLIAHAVGADGHAAVRLNPHD